MKKRKSIILTMSLIMMTAGMKAASFADAGDSANIILTDKQIEKHKENNDLQSAMKERGEELEKKAGAVEMGMSLDEYEKLMDSDDAQKKEKAKEAGVAGRYQAIYQSRIDAGFSDLNLYIADYTRENLERYASVCFSFIDDHNKSRKRAIIIVTNNYSKEINKLNKELGIDETYEMIPVPKKEDPAISKEYIISDEDRKAGIEDVSIDDKNFPDENFRKVVKEEFDSNKNDVLDKDEIINARKIDLIESDNGTEVKSVEGIEKLSFLEDASLGYSEISEIDISKNLNLRRLSLASTKVSNLDTSNNQLLWYLDFTGTNVSSIDLTKNPKLEQIHGFDSKIKEIDVSKNPELLRLDVCRTAISKIDVSNNPKLFALNFEETGVSEIDVSKNKDLYEVYASNSKISEIDVSNNEKLGHIRVTGTKVKNLDLSHNPNLVFVMAEETDMKTLDLGHNHDIIEILANNSNLENIIFPYKTGIKTMELGGTKLKNLSIQGDKYIVGLDISNTDISNLDVSKAEGLSRLEVEGTPIKNLNIKNNKSLRIFNISNTNIEDMKNIDLSENEKDRLDTLSAENAGIESIKLPKEMSEIATIKLANNNLAIVDLSNASNAWYEKSISPQEIEVEGLVQNGNIKVNMASLVDDLSKIKIADTDSYSYKDGVVTFKNKKRINKFKYEYETGTNDKILKNMTVNVTVKSKFLPSSSSSRSRSNNHSSSVSNLENNEEINLKDNRSEKNDVDKIKSLIKAKNSRISGSNRFSTAVEVSKMNYKKSETVILANSEKATDILTTSPLAESLECPVLYTKDNAIPEETISEMERLGVKRVIVIGGKKSVSDSVFKELSSKYELNRVAGSDRFDTANKIAKEVVKRSSEKKKAIMVSSESYADALTISSLATKENIPIVITNSKNLSEKTEEFLKNNEIKEIVYVGGNNSISNEVQKETEKKGIKTVARYAGKDRYETATIISNNVRPDSDFSVYVNGENLSDAITANSLCANLKSPILLVKKDTIPDPVKKTMDGKARFNRIIVGGENSVSKNVEKEIKEN
ncbi:hypothetical protein HLB30_06345 [Peptostreptococcus russellii]|uniref:cell wall-binding repeat-containing protein n=1 Tax=Peptostreptococcus russellii TaxID=215200 RepID=UPI00162AE6B0|nr:cell wall-binding repeat-containing protein [Peptostreptococcus russellii]MBC2578140.1 hypothetical protein [Peptostreptococcus russellii]